jgi:F-type H+-transporting ATPase subunit a
MRTVGSVLLLLTIAGAPAVGAQEPHAPTVEAQAGQRPAFDSLAAAEASEAVQGSQDAAHDTGEREEAVDIITPHITDSRELEVPYWRPPFYKEVHLPHWASIQIGGFSIDLSPTKHVVMLLLAATLCALTLITAAVAHGRHSHATGRPHGFAAGIEAMVLYIRNEVALRNIHGPGAEKYVPFILTLFFFILFANLLGLIPYGSTATGNISVTLTLALITFVVVEVAGMRALGPAYLSTIFYWNKDLPAAMRVPMFLLMSPVELIGKFTKPFALTIRLFANMTAGHIVVLAFIGLIFFFGNVAAGAPFLMAVAIMVLEIFVAFLQAFIFALLAAVFIGQIRAAHH